MKLEALGWNQRLRDPFGQYEARGLIAGRVVVDGREPLDVESETGSYGAVVAGRLDEDGEPIAWEQLGDLRYQFLNYIDQVTGIGFGGVAAPLADPTSGELIVANASISAAPIESMATTALEYFNHVVAKLGTNGFR